MAVKTASGTVAGPRNVENGSAVIKPDHGLASARGSAVIVIDTS